MSKSKSRNFSFIIYPSTEDLPEDWQALLEALGIPMAISPLHDKDKTEPKSKERIRKEAERAAKEQCAAEMNEEKRKILYENAKAYWINRITADQINLPEFKKPHHHVLYVAHNPVTAESVLKKIRRKLGNSAVGYVEIVDNIENYYLYLTHESAYAKEKKKPVYPKKDIKLLNAFDISRYITMDKEQKKGLFVKLIELVDKQNIMNMKQLLAYIREHGKEIGISDVGELIQITDSNAWFLKMVFDGNYQETKFKALRMEDLNKSPKASDPPLTLDEYTRNHDITASKKQPAEKGPKPQLTDEQKKQKLLEANGAENGTVLINKAEISEVKGTVE